MASYVVLCNFTDQGIRNVKESVHRAEAVEAAARKMGITMTQILWTQGAHDIVVLFDAPDEATMTAFGLAVGMQGNVRTETLRAFSRAEMGAILAKLPG